MRGTIPVKFKRRSTAQLCDDPLPSRDYVLEGCSPLVSIQRSIRTTDPSNTNRGIGHRFTDIDELRDGQ